MSALLEIDGLQTAYGSSQVLFGISFSIQAGDVATLLGRNGMGKTTTVRSILGLTRMIRTTAVWVLQCSDGSGRVQDIQAHATA